MTTSIIAPTNLAKEDGTVVTPKGNFIMSYDTASNTVQDYFQFPDTTPLIVLKATFVNTVETYGQAYLNSLNQILAACKEIHDKNQAGIISKMPLILDPNQANGLIGKFQMRMEESYARLNKWEGYDEFHALFPYSEIATEPNELIGRPPIVDTRNTKPYVNGIFFVVGHKYNDKTMFGDQEDNGVSV